MKIILRTAFISLTLTILSACGGGGGGGGDGGGGGGAKIDPIESPGPTDGPYAMFEASLHAYDVTDTSKVFHISDSKVEESETLFSATLSNNNTVVSNFVAEQFIYLADGGLYSINMKQGSDLKSRQISSINSGICDFVLQENMITPNASYVIFSTAAMPADCLTGNVSIYLAPVSATSNDAPMDVSTKVRSIYGLQVVDDTNTAGAIAGFLAEFDNSLKFYDSNMQNPVEIISGTNKLTLLHAEGSTELFSYFVLVDDEVYYYDGSANPIASLPVHTVPAGEAIYSDYLDCNATVCIIEQTNAMDESTLYTVPNDGSANSSFFYGPTTGESLDGVTLTDSNIYITTENQTTLDVTFSGSALSAASFSPLASGDIWIGNSDSFAGRVFYTVEDNVTSESVAYHRTDAGTVTTLPKSRWAGGVFTQVNLTQGFGLNKMVLVKSYTDVATGLKDATVVVVDSATGTEELTAGTINDELLGMAFLGYNSTVSGYGYAFNAGTMQVEGDIYFININQADSLVNVTNSPGVSEFPIFF